MQRGASRGLGPHHACHLWHMGLSWLLSYCYDTMTKATCRVHDAGQGAAGGEMENESI